MNATTARRLGGLATIAGLMFAGMVSAQNYPVRPIRMIVPFPPGGSTDTYARVVSPKAAESLGQQIVIDNRTGAGGAIGAELAARAPADGYTLWLGQTANLAIGPALRAKNNYDPIADYNAITLVQRASSVLVVSPSSPLKNLKDLIDLAQKKPDGLTYGSAGVGTAGHLNGHLLNLSAGINLTHVPYKGAAPAVVDLMAGRITIMATSIGSSASFIRQGKMRAIATTGYKRARQLPEIPTAMEQGLKNFEVTTWHVFMAPAKTSPVIVELLNKHFVAALNLPEMQEKLMSEGGEVTPTTSKEANAFVKSEVQKWGTLIRKAGITAD